MRCVSDRELRLLERARAGDRGAEERLVRHFEPVLRAFAASARVPEPLWDDLRQELRIACLRAIRRWRPEMSGSFGTYLYQACQNEVVNVVRRARPLGYRAPGAPAAPVVLSLDAEEVQWVPDSRPAADRDLAARSARAAFTAWVRSLLADSPETLRTVELRYGLDGGGDRSLAEVARSLGVSVGAVKSRLHRARVRLSQGSVGASGAACLLESFRE